MSKVVKAEEATLKTMAIAIRAISVNNKQMTLAVFRQLPTTEIVDAKGEKRELNYWGIVRYPIRDEGKLWAVAEVEGQLFRCRVIDADEAETENMFVSSLREMYGDRAQALVRENRLIHSKAVKESLEQLFIAV